MMISVRDVYTGQKVDVWADEGDWWSATIDVVELRRKKPYAIVSWDKYPAWPKKKVLDEDGGLRTRTSEAFKKQETFERHGGNVGRNPDGTYTVDRIVAERKDSVKGTVRYKVRWLGWSSKHDEWKRDKDIEDSVIKQWQRARRKPVKSTKQISKRKPPRPSYVLSLPVESDDAEALRRSEAVGDVKDLALDAIMILKKARKAEAKKQLQRKTGVSGYRFRALHKYLRELIDPAAEDGEPDDLVTPIQPKPATDKTVDAFQVWSPTVIRKAIGAANDLDNGNGVLNLRADDKLLTLAVPWTVQYERTENHPEAREVMKVTGHVLSALAETGGYRLGKDATYPYDVKDRNAYRRTIARDVMSCGARCGQAKVPLAMKRWAARVEAGKEDEPEDESEDGLYTSTEYHTMYQRASHG